MGRLGAGGCVSSSFSLLVAVVSPSCSSCDFPFRLLELFLVVLIFFMYTFQFLHIILGGIVVVFLKKVVYVDKFASSVVSFVEFVREYIEIQILL